MATPALPFDPAGYVEVKLYFHPDTGDFKISAPRSALMLALAMLELGRHELLKLIFQTPRAVIPVRSIPRIS